jgi:hypothetical protein
VNQFLPFLQPQIVFAAKDLRLRKMDVNIGEGEIDFNDFLPLRSTRITLAVMSYMPFTSNSSGGSSRSSSCAQTSPGNRSKAKRSPVGSPAIPTRPFAQELRLPRCSVLRGMPSGAMFPEVRLNVGHQNPRRRLSISSNVFPIVRPTFILLGLSFWS